MITDDTRVWIWRRDKFKCRYCGYDAGASYEAFRRAYLTIDHLKPRKYGGTDDKNNLFTCCRACKAYKGRERLDSVENVQRFLRLYWAECSRPWFDAYVKGGQKHPSSWDWKQKRRKARMRFDAGDDEPDEGERL